MTCARYVDLLEPAMHDGAREGDAGAADALRCAGRSSQGRRRGM